MNKFGEINSLMPQIMQRIGHIAKDREVTGGGARYKYRSVEQVLQRLNPVLIDLGCSITADVIEFTIDRFDAVNNAGKNTNKCRTVIRMEVAFWGPDGSCLVNTAVGEGLDTDGDKAAYKAASGAFKYACFFGLCVPVDRKAVNDPDNHQGDDPRTAPPEKKTDAAEAAIRKAPAAELTRYAARIRQRAESGEYTAEEAAYLMSVLEIRSNDLTAGRS